MVSMYVFKRLKRRQIISFFAIVLLCIALLEILLEITYLVFPVPLSVPLVYDPVLGYLPRPLANYTTHSSEAVVRVTTNSVGFRDEEFLLSNAKRVAVFGDSQTFGLNVNQDDIFTALLEDKFDDTDVYNLAFGYHGEQKVRNVEKFIPLLKPDLVIYEVFLQEFQDTSFDPEAYHTVTDTEKTWTPAIVMVGSDIKAFFVNRVYASHTVKKLLWRVRSILVSFGLTEQARYAWPMVYAQPSEKASTNFDLQLNRLHGMTQTFNDTPFVFFILPDRIHIYPEIFEEYVRLNRLDPASFDIHLPLNLIMEYCVANNLTCIDGREYMSKHKETPLYFHDDFHLTAYGHSVVADLLKDEIEPLLMQQ